MLYMEDFKTNFFIPFSEVHSCSLLYDGKSPSKSLGHFQVTGPVMPFECSVALFTEVRHTVLEAFKPFPSHVLIFFFMSL